jgi:hypothetical protein
LLMERISLEFEATTTSPPPEGSIVVVGAQNADTLAAKLAAAVGDRASIAIVQDGRLRVYERDGVRPIEAGGWATIGSVKVRLRPPDARSGMSIAENSMWAAPEVELCAPGVQRGFGTKHRLPMVDGGSMVFGRADDADLRVRDEHASRRHASITRREGAYVLTDLGSRWGTTVNGDRVVAPRRLEHLDEIRIGGTTILFTSYGDRLLEAIPALPPPLPARAEVPLPSVPTQPDPSVEPSAESATAGSLRVRRDDVASRGRKAIWLVVVLLTVASLAGIGILTAMVFFGVTTEQMAGWISEVF